MSRAKGFSLLEVLAALALLALLLLGVYSGVSMTTASVRRGTLAIDRLDEVRSARELLRRELSEATALPWAVSDARRPMVFAGRSDTLRFVAPLPGYLGKRGAQVLTLHLRDEADGTQTLEMAFAPLPMSASPLPPAAPEALLKGLHGMRFRYAASDGAWTDTWGDRTVLPALVQIDTGGQAREPEWPTLTVAPRETAAALNGAAYARGLAAGDLP